MAKQRGGGQLSAGGGGELGGPLGAPEGSLSPTPTKRTPDSSGSGSSGAKKCESGLKSDLGGNFTTKLKIEPGDSPHGDLTASGHGMTEAELTARRLASLSENSDHLSPRKEPGAMGMAGAHYGDKYGLIGKEECGLGVAGGHPGHPGMAMSLEPNLHHLTDPSVSCNNFSVDSIMTTVSRDGSPDRLDMAGYRGGPWAPGPGHSPSYPACLYPGPGGQTSLEELSSMTAACLSNQSGMGGLYPRPSWYSMPGHHSPSNIVNPDQTFPQTRPEYFDPIGKAPSPLPAGCGEGEQGAYRSPTYRTNYYPQDCEKY